MPARLSESLQEWIAGPWALGYQTQAMAHVAQGLEFALQTLQSAPPRQNSIHFVQVAKLPPNCREFPGP